MSSTRAGAVPPLQRADSQLLSAASAGRLEQLQVALEAGGNVNTVDFCGDSPLLLAARGQHVECCHLLVTAGADANQQGSKGETAVMVAVQHGCSQLLEAVLTPTADLSIRTDGGLTAFQLACLRRRPTILQRLLQHQRVQLGLDAPLPAQVAGHLSDEPVQSPSQVPAVAQLAAGRQLVLAVYAAVAAGDPACLQLLVSEPLTRAAYQSQFGASAAAAPHWEPEQQAQDQQAHQQQHHHHHRRQRDVREEEQLQGELSFLLDSDIVGGANCRAASFLWQTNGLPCHLAAAINQPDCLHTLLSSGLASPDERTAEGFTPLMLAATADATASAAVLLGAGAELEARNHASRTALFLAAVSGSPGVLALLIQASANVNAAEDTRLCSPLIAAVARAASLEPSQPAKAAAFLQCAGLLVAAGADTNHAAKDGSTALHAAAEGGSPRCLELLLGKEGTALDAADSLGRTALAGAVSRRHMQCAMMLLAKGAAVTSDDMAARVLDCLLNGTTTTDVVTVWQLLAVLNSQQLKALSACPKFYDLPHTDSPQQLLPAAAVGAMLEIASEGMTNLLYNASPADNVSQGRRPAYLLELLRRMASSTAGAHMAAPGAAGADGAATATSGTFATSADRAAVQQMVAASPHVAKLLSMWASAQMLLQYASCIARCMGIPQRDREQLSMRVGQLFSAYHALACLLTAAGLSFSRAVERPHAPLAAATLPAAAPMQQHIGHVGPLAANVEQQAAAGSSRQEEQSVADPIEQQAEGDAAKDEMEGIEVADPLQPAHQQQQAPAEASLSAGSTGARAASSSPSGSQQHLHRQPSQHQHQHQHQSQEEAAICAALRPFADAIDALIGCIADQTQLRSWLFVLEYRQVANLACKQRLLQSILAAWPRRHDSMLALSTGRAGMLQRVCSAVEERQLALGEHSTTSMGSALWHGINVAFEEENGTGDGVRREWFRLLAAELTNPDTGLFESHDGGATFSPAPHSSIQCDGSGHLHKFELVGCMVGLAILQGCTLPGFRLTPATWRLLLGQPPRPMEDLHAADPLLHRNLHSLCQLGADVAELGLHFEVHDSLGRAVELCSGGGQQAVTAASLGRYIALLVQYKQVDSIAAESAALAKGMLGVLTGGVVDTLARCFDHAELNVMVAGLTEIDLADWQAAVRYEHCTPQSPHVGWLWRAVAAMEPAQHRQLLAFVTGGSTLPAGGFSTLRGFNGALHAFTVSLVAVEGDERLPRASTCFNTLFLPRYSSPAVLHMRLLQAIGAQQTFDEGVIRR